MAPGKTILPVASMIRSAGGRSSGGASATMRPSRMPRQDLAEWTDDAGAADQLEAVLDTRLGDADHEHAVLVGARAQDELVLIERQR